jgi:hypothetical protein
MLYPVPANAFQRQPAPIFHVPCAQSSGTGLFRVQGRGWRYFTAWQQAVAFAERVGGEDFRIWAQFFRWVRRPVNVHLH